MAGPLLLLIIVLADVGLVVWGWHLREQKKAAEYGSSGLNFASVPAPEPPRARPALPAAAVQAPSSGGPVSVVPEKLAAAAPSPAPPRSGSLLKKAEGVYYLLKNSPRFKDSRTLREWKREFLSHPDLAAIDARYRKDANARRFIRDMVRSPDFKRMLARYAPRPDLQAFLKEMAGKEAVTAAASLFSDDGEVMGVCRSLRIPGAAAQAAPPPRRLELKRGIDEEGVSSEALRSAETGSRR